MWLFFLLDLPYLLMNPSQAVSSALLVKHEMLESCGDASQCVVITCDVGSPQKHRLCGNPNLA